MSWGRLFHALFMRNYSAYHLLLRKRSDRVLEKVKFRETAQTLVGKPVETNPAVATRRDWNPPAKVPGVRSLGDSLGERFVPAR